MFRLPLKNLTTRHARAYAAPTGSNPKKQPDNTLMYVALGLAAAGGAYFYFKNPEDVQDLKAKAKREAEQVKQKGKETVDAVKGRADDTVRRGEAEYGQVKAEGKAKLEDVRAAADREKVKYEGQGRSIAQDVESKYEAAKDATRDGLAKAESVYSEAERKGEEGKAGWFSWLRKQK